LAQISKLDFPLIELSTQLDLLYNMVAKSNKVGALTTTKYGAIAAIPELNEL
jgi:fructokinase